MYLISLRWRHLKSITSFTYAFVLRFREKRHIITSGNKWNYTAYWYHISASLHLRVCWTRGLVLSDPEVSPNPKEATTILQSWNKMCFTSDILVVI